MSDKLHPLHEPEVLLQRMLNTREYPDRLRGTGRSTAFALKYIAQAIESPYIPVKLRDHHHAHVESYSCRANFAASVVSTIELLGLQHMKTKTINGEFHLQFGE